MTATLMRCKLERLRREKAIERAQRISKIDPTKDNTRIAMIPLDSSVVGMPRDLRRVASYTTLYVLGTGSQQRARSHWHRIRSALEWMIAYWRSQKQGLTISEAKLNTKDTDLIAPYSNLIKVSPLHVARNLLDRGSLRGEAKSHPKRWCTCNSFLANMCHNVLLSTFCPITLMHFTISVIIRRPTCNQNEDCMNTINAQNLPSMFHL